MGSELLKASISLNASTEEDFCPVCFTRWPQLPTTAPFAVLLPCNHAVCARCLARFHQTCAAAFDASTDGDAYDIVKLHFVCSLCRHKLPQSIVRNAAADILERSLVPDLAQFTPLFPFQVHANQMFASLLVENAFDVGAVESALLSLVSLGLISAESGAALTHTDKQAIYAQARAPAQALYAAVCTAREELDDMFDTDSKDYAVARARLAELEKKLHAARVNAAKDIFERTNTDSRMGAITGDSKWGGGEWRLTCMGCTLKRRKARWRSFCYRRCRRFRIGGRW
jgi:hypothetical protein